jgi:hypothetical protein
MSTTPRVTSEDGQAASLATALARTPETATRFFELYAEYWQRGISPVAIREMTRLRNARVTDCRF